METSDPGSGRPAMAGRAVLLVAAAFALVAGGACSGGGDDDDQALTESINSSQPEGQGEGGEAATDDEGNDADQGEGDDPASGEVLGTTRADLTPAATDRSVPVRIDLTRLERSGELVEIGLVLTNEAEAPTDGSEPLTFGRGSFFADGGVNAGYDASGIGLVDGEGQKLYLPAYDSDGNCLCSGWYSDETISPGGRATIEATIGGVPEDVERVDVRLPNFPAISGATIR